MIDREKVINDLNVAKLILCKPQMLAPEMCIRVGQAITSAINLLKEQEPRVMTLEEARNVEVVWVEDRSTREIYPCIVKNNMNDSKLYKYGVQWRCWTSRPTEEQRTAAPWSEPPKEADDETD